MHTFVSSPGMYFVCEPASISSTWPRKMRWKDVPLGFWKLAMVVSVAWSLVKPQARLGRLAVSRFSCLLILPSPVGGGTVRRGFAHIAGSRVHCCDRLYSCAVPLRHQEAVAREGVADEGLRESHQSVNLFSKRYLFLQKAGFTSRLAGAASVLPLHPLIR